MVPKTTCPMPSIFTNTLNSILVIQQFMVDDVLHLESILNWTAGTAMAEDIWSKFGLVID